MMHVQENQSARESSKNSAGARKTTLRHRRESQSESLPIVRLPPKVIGGLQDQMVKIKQCNCKRSSCLKLYCDCFQCGIHCSSICNCKGCENVAGNKNRAQAILVALDRRPNVFRHRLLSLGGAVEERNGAEWKKKIAKGCKCKMSRCLKKYCECFDAAVYCSYARCKCVECCNLEGNTDRENLMSVRQKRLEAAADFVSQKRARVSREEGEEQVPATVGVDAFLPPLAYAIPVKLSTGEPFPALAFGSTTLEQTKNPITAILEKSEQVTCPISPRPLKGNLTELETSWGSQIMKMNEVFESFEDEIQNQKEQDESPKYDNDSSQLSGQKLLRTTKIEAKRLIETVNNAERETIKFLNILPEKQIVNNLVSVSNVDLDKDQTLLCSETVSPDPNDSELSSSTVQEFAIMAAQDTALLRELTAIIRQKTLLLTKMRKGAS